MKTLDIECPSRTTKSRKFQVKGIQNKVLDYVSGVSSRSQEAGRGVLKQAREGQDKGREG